MGIFKGFKLNKNIFFTLILNQNLIHHLHPDGYTCVNEEQINGYKCVDMEIRFCCPNKYSAGQCNVDGYTWSGWHNSDGPGDDGDWEGENS